MRIGLHAGEVAVERGNAFGINVIIAQRASGGRVFMAERVYTDAQRALNGAEHLRWNDLGEKQLKGLQKPVKIFEVVG